MEDNETEALDLPKPLTDTEVPAFLEPYGFYANSHVLWRCQPPRLGIRVTGHSAIGGHVHYRVECMLDRLRSSEEKVAWHVDRRLAHLREGLHNPLKKALGSSYPTYFCGVRFAHRLRPTGTTVRLDAWCERLAYCISGRLAPPHIAAETLRILGAPPSGEIAASSSRCGTPASCGSAAGQVSPQAGLEDVFLLTPLTPTPENAAAAKACATSGGDVTDHTGVGKPPLVFPVATPPGGSTTSGADEDSAEDWEEEFGEALPQKDMLAFTIGVGEELVPP